MNDSKEGDIEERWLKWADRNMLRRTACAMNRAIFADLTIDEAEHYSAVCESLSTAKLRREVALSIARCRRLNIDVSFDDARRVLLVTNRRRRK